MKRVLAILAAVGMAAGMAVGLQAGPAVSQEEGPPPEHPHMLVLGLELDEEGEPVGFRRCVDLAAGQALPLNAHHMHVHQGQAGEALFTKAGHVAVPGAPLTPWSNCEELIAFFFGN